MLAAAGLVTLSRLRGSHVIGCSLKGPISASGPALDLLANAAWRTHVPRTLIMRELGYHLPYMYNLQGGLSLPRHHSMPGLTSTDNAPNDLVADSPRKRRAFSDSFS